jgi:hypothetical protein
MSDDEPVPDEAGRRRIAERDRKADIGERRQEYEQGDGWVDPDDSLAEARRQAVEDDPAPSESHPGMTARDEEWQREKQMLGQDADEPGLPHTRKAGPQRTRQRGEGRDEPAGRDGLAVPGGEETGEGEDAGTGTGGERRPLREDEIPDSRDVTQG